MADDRSKLDQVRETLAAWRGFAVQAGDIIHGRNHAWDELRRLRLAVMTLPLLGDDEPNPCRALIALTGEIATSSDCHSHFHEINRLKRLVLHRCEQAEVGLDILSGMLEATRAA